MASILLHRKKIESIPRSVTYRFSRGCSLYHTMISSNYYFSLFNAEFIASTCRADGKNMAI